MQNQSDPNKLPIFCLNERQGNKMLVKADVVVIEKIPFYKFSQTNLRRDNVPLLRADICNTTWVPYLGMQKTQQDPKHNARPMLHDADLNIFVKYKEAADTYGTLPDPLLDDYLNMLEKEIVGRNIHVIKDYNDKGEMPTYCVSGSRTNVEKLYAELKSQLLNEPQGDYNDYTDGCNQMLQGFLHNFLRNQFGNISNILLSIKLSEGDKGSFWNQHKYGKLLRDRLKHDYAFYFQSSPVYMIQPEQEDKDEKEIQTGAEELDTWISKEWASEGKSTLPFQQQLLLNIKQFDGKTKFSQQYSLNRFKKVSEMLSPAKKEKINTLLLKYRTQVENSVLIQINTAWTGTAKASSKLITTQQEEQTQDIQNIKMALQEILTNMDILATNIQKPTWTFSLHPCAFWKNFQNVCLSINAFITITGDHALKREYDRIFKQFNSIQAQENFLPEQQEMLTQKLLDLLPSIYYAATNFMVMLKASYHQVEGYDNPISRASKSIYPPPHKPKFSRWS